MYTYLPEWNIYSGLLTSYLYESIKLYCIVISIFIVLFRTYACYVYLSI